MNARLYDPVLGRFLSPDPFVQMPDFTQNFNRYSYCLNNPLVYVDENGEFCVTTMLIGPNTCSLEHWLVLQSALLDIQLLREHLQWHPLALDS